MGSLQNQWRPFLILSKTHKWASYSGHLCASLSILPQSCSCSVFPFKPYRPWANNISIFTSRNEPNTTIIIPDYNSRNNTLGIIKCWRWLCVAVGLHHRVMNINKVSGSVGQEVGNYTASWFTFIMLTAQFAQQLSNSPQQTLLLTLFLQLWSALDLITAHCCCWFCNRKNLDPIHFKQFTTAKGTHLTLVTQKHAIWPFKWQMSTLVTLGHPGLTYIFNFWQLGTMALNLERQSARMSEIKNEG